MAIKILMPALSPTMTEGNLTKWLVKEGDEIKAGDILAEIETDKATMEVEAVDEGRVSKILVKEGQESVKVNTPIAILDGMESSEEINQNSHNTNETEELEKIDTRLEFTNYEKENDNFDNIKFNKKELDKNEYIASPLVKKISRENNIDLTLIKGSGPKGRIIKRDIENSNFQKLGNQLGENPSTMRKIIAERTTLTKQTVPHFYLSIESNLDKLLEMRKKINNESETKISINDIFVKALALAQKMNPLTNISWVKGKIIKYNSVDVSIAVALDEGLITPIIKNADLKGLLEISNEIKDLVKKSKEGKLLQDDYTGGTISLSNLGMFGITEFQAIINPPQSSILAVGAIQKLPRVINNKIKVVNILKSSLSADHRVLDGAVAGKLLKDFNDIIENPFDLWLMSKDMEII